MYRVDLRLRPFGTAGELVPTISALVDYYGKRASLWEVQAALKMRPIAGNRSVGEKLLERIRPILTSKRKLEEICETLHRMRRRSNRAPGVYGLTKTPDVKVGIGGIRDIEFFVQGHQLLHGHNNPKLLGTNTLEAIDALAAQQLIGAKVAKELKKDYIFLRRVEHFLQIYEDRQVHALPAGHKELEALAKRVLGHGADARDLSDVLERVRERVTAIYDEKFGGLEPS